MRVRTTAVLVTLAFAASASASPARAEEGEPAAAPVQPVANAEARPVLHVDGVAALAALGPDPVVDARVNGLASRRRGAALMMAGSGASLAAAGILALVARVSADLSNAGVGSTCSAFGGDCDISPNYRPAYVALGVSAALAVASALVWPRRSDEERVVTLWNARHPDVPVALPPAEPRAPDGPAGVP